MRRRRWDAPDASYGVCYLAFDSHIAFAETMLRDLALDVVHEQDLKMRSLACIEVCEPLHLVGMNGKHLRRPDGIRYRARHDDSGFSLALFERAQQKIHCLVSTPLLDPTNAPDLARWLDRYDVGLTS